MSAQAQQALLSYTGSEGDSYLLLLLHNVMLYLLYMPRRFTVPSSRDVKLTLKCN
jgi:hypothetical protein